MIDTEGTTNADDPNPLMPPPTQLPPLLLSRRTATWNTWHAIRLFCNDASRAENTPPPYTTQQEDCDMEYFKIDIEASGPARIHKPTMPLP